MPTQKLKTLTKNKSESWALPGEPLTSDTFVKSIKEVEKGSFYTIEESKEVIAKWRKQRNSK